MLDLRFDDCLSRCVLLVSANSDKEAIETKGQHKRGR